MGNVTFIYGMMKVLNELAVEAAKKIEFRPKKVNGKPVDTFKLIVYDYLWDGFWKVGKQLTACPAKKTKKQRKK